MATESNARLVESSDLSKDRIRLDGLEGFFEDDHEELYAKGLSIKQAVFYYGDTRKSLKVKVMEGSVPAIRLPDAHGGKWRVFPDGVPPRLQELIPKKLRSDANTQDELSPPATATKKKAKNGSSPEPADNNEQSTKQKKKKHAAPVESENTLDFSIPGVDYPGELILKAAGFLVKEDVFNEPTVGESFSATNFEQLISQASTLLPEITQAAPLEQTLADFLGAPPTFGAAETTLVFSDTAPVNSEEIPEIFATAVAISEAAPTDTGVASISSETQPVDFNEDPAIVETGSVILIENPIAAETSPAIISEVLLISETAPGALTVDSFTIGADDIASLVLGESIHLALFHANVENTNQTYAISFEQEYLRQEKAAATIELNSKAPPFDQVLEKINLLEKQLMDASYRNSYLETRLTGLEDQVVFLTQAHCQNRSFNKLLLIIPALILFAAILMFRFTGQAQL